ncbi:MAG: site-specific integrase [Acidimicrobiia bacterium]
MGREAVSLRAGSSDGTQGVPGAFEDPQVGGRRRPDRRYSVRSGAAPPDRAPRDAVPRPRRRRPARQRHRPPLPSVLLLGAYGGLRSGKLFALRRARLDLVQCRVDVAETAVEVAGHFHFGPPKTRAGRRTVPLPRFVIDELAAHIGDIAGHELVFPAPEGGPIRASLFRRRIWEPAVTKAGVGPLRPHDLRHTAVALWIAAGASAHEVARRAGHTSSSVVLDRYGHLLPHAEERVTHAARQSRSCGCRERSERDRARVPARRTREEWPRARCEPAAAACGTGSDLGR